MWGAATCTCFVFTGLRVNDPGEHVPPTLRIQGPVNIVEDTTRMSRADKFALVFPVLPLWCLCKNSLLSPNRNFSFLIRTHCLLLSVWSYSLNTLWGSVWAKHTILFGWSAQTLGPFSSEHQTSTATAAFSKHISIINYKILFILTAEVSLEDREHREKILKQASRALSISHFEGLQLFSFEIHSCFANNPHLRHILIWLLRH